MNDDVKAVRGAVSRAKEFPNWAEHKVTKSMERILDQHEAMVKALEHYAKIADDDGAAGRDRRTIARETLAKVNNDKKAGE